ncbi:MAG: transglutaminase-like cysteine peptidase [Roseobacter sp.]
MENSFVHSLARVRKYAPIVGFAASFMFTLTANTAHAGSSAFLSPQNAIKAPPGFHRICNTYSWACTRTGQSGLSDAKIRSLAKKINSSVNRQVSQIEDIDQYGRAEHWALPTHRGGDCEDLVLLKKKLLIAQGVSSEDLLIATVLDHKLRSHAVLILRSDRGDLVLDNLTNTIKPWQKTGYTFLKLQNPKNLARWDAVLAGGVIKDRPTASR